MIGRSDETVAEKLFVFAARLSGRAPQFRGKVRLILALYRLLRLEGRHVSVRAEFRRPVRYAAEIDLHSWLQRFALVAGGYEPETAEFLIRLRDLSGRKGYVLDVGANVGLIAIPTAKLLGHPSPAVIAIEAVPDNVRRLLRNIELNHLAGTVSVIPQGVGAVAGSVEIQVEGDLHAGEGTGTANILPVGSTYACVRQTIEISTIDELASAGRVPSGCSVVKIDTDGYDLQVLQGAEVFLRRERPLIFGEFAEHCLKWHGQSAADVQCFAAKHGYSAWKVDRKHTFTRFAAPDPSFSQDLLLVPHELESRLHSIHAL